MGANRRIPTRMTKGEISLANPTCAFEGPMKLRAIWSILGCVALIAAGCSESEPPRGTAIIHVTVIDAAEGPRANHTVIFDGDEILAVAPSDSAELPPAAETIDGSGKFLIPGLWDMHVHLTYDDGFADSMPELFLAHGITSVRDTVGLIDKLQPVVEAMRAPDARAPRVFFSGPLLDGEFVVYDGGSSPEIGTQNSTVEMAEANVAALVGSGVDFIKTYEMLSPEVFEALTAAGQRAGLPIAAHIPLSMLARDAGPSVDSMEHLRNVELDCAGGAEELLQERLDILAAHEEGPGGALRSRLHSLQRLPAVNAHDEERCDATIASLASTIQVPTLRLNTLSMHPPFDRSDWEEGVAMVPTEVRDQWSAMLDGFRDSAFMRDTTFGEWTLSMVGRMHAAGVPIGAGTDTPIGLSIPGYSLHTELERLVDAGLSPIEAIESATVRPAEFFSLEDEMGSIRIGQRADLVLLDANPLEDIANTRSIHKVVSKGVVVIE